MSFSSLSKEESACFMLDSARGGIDWQQVRAGELSSSYRDSCLPGHGAAGQLTIDPKPVLWADGYLSTASAVNRTLIRSKSRCKLDSDLQGQALLRSMYKRAAAS